MEQNRFAKKNISNDKTKQTINDSATLMVHTFHFPADKYLSISD